MVEVVPVLALESKALLPDMLRVQGMVAREEIVIPMVKEGRPTELPLLQLLLVVAVEDQQVQLL